MRRLHWYLFMMYGGDRKKHKECGAMFSSRCDSGGNKKMLE